MKNGKIIKLIVFSTITLLIFTCSKKEDKQNNVKNTEVSSSVLSDSQKNKVEEEKKSSIVASVKDIVDEIRKEKEITDNDKTLEAKEEELFESTEGGKRKYYYKNNILVKVEDMHYGESGEFYQEYYIKNNKIYFSYILRSAYNVLYYVTKEMAEKNGSKEYFDPSKTIKEERRFYFNPEEKLVRLIDEKGKMIEDVKVLQQEEEQFKEDVTFKR